MTKLTNLQPRLGGLSTCLSDPQPHDRNSSTRIGAEPWQAWYKERKWKALRLKVLARDAYICQATGTLCVGEWPAPNSPVVDHKRQHRGNLALFWDIDNLQTVTKAYHDSVKQKQERTDIKGVWY